MTKIPRDHYTPGRPWHKFLTTDSSLSILVTKIEDQDQWQANKRQKEYYDLSHANCWEMSRLFRFGKTADGKENVNRQGGRSIFQRRTEKEADSSELAREAGGTTPPSYSSNIH